MGNVCGGGLLGANAGRTRHAYKSHLALRELRINLFVKAQG